ncbi:MAG TPA: hypothetical protein VHC22_14925 [Pirellulales bacterium]|nr:hypothetical protein [Pirellulales bacterium]
MRVILRDRYLFLAVLAAFLGLARAGVASAQTGSIDPNPTMPFDPASELQRHDGASGSGARFGRGTGGQAGAAAEENPAETMLREIDGTNYGRHRGHAITPNPSQNAQRVTAKRAQRDNAPTPPPSRKVGTVAVGPIGGRPENRWRYHLYRGRWWYQLDGNRWSYYDGTNWQTYHSAAASRPAKPTR